MAFQLDDYQIDAVKRLSYGSILCGGYGSGKSITGLAFYFIDQGGSIDGGHYIPMEDPPADLYIITTAKKRDSKEWEKELLHFLLNPGAGVYSNKVVIDSWNNIGKYSEVRDAWFIFDEQRVVGKGAWVKAFLKIAKANRWILLTATPGDSWEDYIPVFIANGFYKNRTEFFREHCIVQTQPFFKINGYINEGKLVRLRRQILVQMHYERVAVQHHEDVVCEYNPIIYKDVIKRRWDPYDDKPIQNASGLCYILRKVVNSDPSRIQHLLDIVKEKKRAIIFYNYDYERELLLKCLEMAKVDGALPTDFIVTEWTGHKHQDIPTTSSWAYIVQYNAGAEGWNCTSADTIIFYSQSYSYKMMTQAEGRIARRNTPFHDLYYYHLKSFSSIDVSITRALKTKKNFNESSFANSCN